MIKCLLSRPCLISGPLKPKPKLILTEFQGLTLSTPSLVLHFFLHSLNFLLILLLLHIKRRFHENSAVNFLSPRNQDSMKLLFFFSVFSLLTPKCFSYTEPGPINIHQMLNKMTRYGKICSSCDIN